MNKMVLVPGWLLARHKYRTITIPPTTVHHLPIEYANPTATEGLAESLSGALW